MKKSFLLIFSFLFILSFSLAHQAVARERVDYWYIKDFQTTVEILADDSAIITEDIVADCGVARDKHGIFRIVPTRSKTPEGTIYTPVELISITDFNNRPYDYQSTVQDGTITWKIGSARIKVSGENNYRIKYRVSNVIREQEGSDELYWNLSGNYWDLEIDKFTAKIILIPEISAANSEITLYDGNRDSQNNSFSSYAWTSENILEIESQRTLKVGEGITLSLSFPQGYINHQEIDNPEESLAAATYSTLGDHVNVALMLFFALAYFVLLPIIVLIMAFASRRRQQKKNPYYKRALVAEYSPPENISPIMLGFMDKRVISPHLITASIVRMGFLKLLSITEKEEKNIFNKSKYLEFVKSENQENYNQLDEAEKYIYEAIFKEGNIINSNNLKTSFNDFVWRDLRAIVKTEAKKQDYLLVKNSGLRRKYLIAAIIFFFMGSIFSSIILLIFYAFDRNLGKRGEKLYWEIQGFKKYMKIAEKDRHDFYEKENIFTKLLPYSIAIGNVKEWARKMADIYGEEYIQKSLYWYTGASMMSSLNNVDNITKSISSISSSISSSVGSSSGSGGGGSSGGGSGGGGGGGW